MAPCEETPARGDRGGVEARLVERDEWRELGLCGGHCFVEDRVDGLQEHLRVQGRLQLTQKKEERKAHLELEALPIDGRLDLLSKVDEAPHVRGGVRVECAALDDAAYAWNERGRNHRRDEVAVRPELGLVFVILIFAKRRARIFVERTVPIERVEAAGALRTKR